jgi:hypothetical protein
MNAKYFYAVNFTCVAESLAKLSCSHVMKTRMLEITPRMQCKMLVPFHPRLRYSIQTGLGH